MTNVANPQGRAGQFAAPTKAGGLMPADSHAVTVHVDLCAPGIPCLDNRHTGRMALFALTVGDAPPRHYCPDDIDDRAAHHHAQGATIIYTPAARDRLIREGMRVIA